MSIAALTMKIFSARLYDARTTISTGGAGLATTRIYDDDGPLGVGAESLFVGRR